MIRVLRLEKGAIAVTYRGKLEVLNTRINDEPEKHSVPGDHQRAFSDTYAIKTLLLTPDPDLVR